MSSNSEERVRPVDPERFHLALGLYQAALATESPQANASESSPTPVEKVGAATAAPSADIPANRAILAVKKEFPDTGEFQSLSLRLQRFSEVIGDKKLIKWGMVHHSEGGIEVHDAVINALATAPFRKSGVLDKPAFHMLVKAEYAKLEASSP
ncbi:hypothetical protein [Bradyrhizobium sp.]|uniref:hypothetical protein n=1 Tax=Bradyrhizobium sp. TaxID=376 RepID=UPI003C748905